MNFNNIKTDEKGISFDSAIETRTLTLDAKNADETSAKVNFKIKGFVSFEKALKSAMDFAIIRYRDSSKKAYDKDDEKSIVKWLNDFNGKTIELDIDDILTANSRTGDGTGSVRSAIRKADNEKLIDKMMKSGLSREQAELAINSFLQ